MSSLLKPIRRRFEGATGGDVVFPLAVLFLLFFFDEFDTGAFYTLAPNIKHAFHLTDRAYGGLVVVNVSIIVGLVIPIGHLGDRWRRTRLVVAGAVLAGTFSFLTGVVTTVALLTIVRIGNGVGRLVNEPIHSSLLTDYYKPEHRPRVFSMHRNSQYIGHIAGAALAGIIAALFGWQVAFMVLIVPIAITAFVATKLTEPRRGGTDIPDAAAVAEQEHAPPFREAARTLLAVRTLKRKYVAWVFTGGGSIALLVFLPLYLQRVYHVGDAPRGFFVAANEAFTFAGVIAAGPWTARWMGKGIGEPLRYAGLAIIATAVLLVGFAVSPWLPLALAFGLPAAFTTGVLFPPLLTVQAFVSPARVRSLSFSFSLLFLALGGILYFASPLGRISDDIGIRWAIVSTTPLLTIGGLILISARRFVADDTNAAYRTLETTAALHRERLESGQKSLLRCVGLDVAYDSVQVLFGVDLEVQEGEIVALLGTNGAGKSTLLKAISGLVDPSAGAIFFDSQDVTHADPIKSAKLGIVQMPGGRSVFPTLTVNECLRLAGWLYKRDPEHVKSATAQVREYFPILAERGDSLAGNLSGGEQQMLGLGMAFIAKPRLLMIDELTLGLAPTIVGKLVDIVRAIHAQGTTIILVEQSVNTALLLAQRAVFMEKGEVRFTGPTAELLERDDILRSVFLEGAASASNGKAKPKSKARAKAKAGTTPAVARRQEVLNQPVVLRLHEVTKRFGGIRAVDEVSFELHEGEIFGLIGPNGAGKTTVFDLISGFLIPDSGRITLCDEDITDWAADRRAWAGLGRSFQDARLFPSLTVAENIAVALERHLEVRDPLAAALGLPAVAESETEVAWSVHELIELMGLGAFRNKFVSELSTGSRRIVDLAMAIAHNPTVLILDEPSSGIAQRETEALGPLLKRIQAEAKCSLLVIEHDMPLVTGIADTMLALELGRVVTEGTPTDVVNHPEVVASYLGEDVAVIARSGTHAVAEAAAEVASEVMDEAADVPT